MSEKNGEFILRHKHPKVVEAAFRRKGSEEAKKLAERPKKSLSKEDKEFLNEETAKALPAWLKKLEAQILEADEQGNTENIKMSLFSRWARKNTVLTKELSDSEYYRIVAGEHAPRSRETVLQELQDEQLATYELWLNYLLADEGRRQYEPWFRYTVLSDLTKRDDRGRRRDADTTSGVLPFSAGALARVYDNIKYIIREHDAEKGLAKEFSEPLPGESDFEKEHRKLQRKEANKRKTERLNELTGYPFHEKYIGYLAEEQRAANEKLGYVDGWHDFTNPVELAIISRGTPWCLAGVSVAEGYLSGRGAKVRVYFQDGRPRMGIHVRNKEVKEVRGADDSQNLDPMYAEIAAKELSKYENGDEWQKQAEDARMLGVLLVKLKENPRQELSHSELRFLYSIGSSVQGFGYEPDHRLEELVRMRYPKTKDDVRTLWSNLSQIEKNNLVTKNYGDYLQYVADLPDFDDVKLVDALLKRKSHFEREAEDESSEEDGVEGYENVVSASSFIVQNLKYLKNINGTEVALRLLAKGQVRTVEDNFQKFPHFDPSEFIIGQFNTIKEPEHMVSKVIEKSKSFNATATALLIEKGYAISVFDDIEKFPEVDGTALLERIVRPRPGEGTRLRSMVEALVKFPQEDPTPYLEGVLDFNSRNPYERGKGFFNILTHFKDIKNLDHNWLVSKAFELKFARSLIDIRVLSSLQGVDFTDLAFQFRARDTREGAYNTLKEFLEKANETGVIGKVDCNKIAQACIEGTLVSSLSIWDLTDNYRGILPFLKNLDASIAEAMFDYAVKSDKENKRNTQSFYAKTILKYKENFLDLPKDFVEKLEKIANQ